MSRRLPLVVFLVLGAIAIGTLVLMQSRERDRLDGAEPIGWRPAPEPPPFTKGQVGRLRASSHVTLRVRSKSADDESTGLVVWLAGEVSNEAAQKRLTLRVCGLPMYYGPDRQFEVRRAFPREGRLIVNATLGPTTDSESFVTECEVLLADDPEDATRIRQLSEAVLDPSDSIDPVAFKKLRRLSDLRTVPALWRVVESKGSARLRSVAVTKIIELAHIDSIPRVIRLLEDDTLAHDIRVAVSSLGLPPLGPNGSVPAEGAVAQSRSQMIDFCLRRFRSLETALREGLHQ